MDFFRKRMSSSYEWDLFCKRNYGNILRLHSSTENLIKIQTIRKINIQNADTIHSLVTSFYNSLMYLNLMKLLNRKWTVMTDQPFEIIFTLPTERDVRTNQ